VPLDRARRVEFVQWPIARQRFWRVAPLLALSLAVAGCPGPSAVRPEAGAAERAAHLVAAGDHAGAAALYDQLASQSTGADREAALADAARQWLAAGTPAKAAASYAHLPAPGPGTAPERILLGADVALANGDANGALALLGMLPERLPPATAAAAAADRASAQFALGHLAEAVHTLVAREALLSPGELAASRQHLWDALRAGVAAGGDLTVPAGSDPVTAGWLELARVAASGSRNPFVAGPRLQAWRAKYPHHPAESTVVPTLFAAAGAERELLSQVALLLPLSGRAAASADALRDGFMTAYYQQDAAHRPQVRIYDVGNDAVGVYQRAVGDGANVVVGPLTKEHVQAVAALAPPGVITIALNVLPDTAPVPPRFYQFALAPEDEARQVAERLLAQGQKVGVALVPSGEWGTRVLAAFRTALEAGGGKLVMTRNYSSAMTDFSDVLGELLGFGASRARYRALASALGASFEFVPRRQEDLQFILVLGQPGAGRLIRPQLKYLYAGDLPVYSISDIYDPNRVANQDMDGVIFTDMPWMLATDADVADVRDEVQALWPSETRRRGRLYAMGFDAYRLIGELRVPEPLTPPVAGMTGHLSLGQGGRIHRALDWGQIQSDGSVQPPAAAASN
jgi:outer membrane PBP1 activator LpoA protein